MQAFTHVSLNVMIAACKLPCLRLHGLLRLLSALVVAFALSATAAAARQDCCPMLTMDAPCPAAAADVCTTACALCQVQPPFFQVFARSVTLTDTPLKPLVGISLDQILSRPAIPPPRTSM